MNPKDREAWNAAEWAYSSIHAAQMMSLPGMSPSSDTTIEQLADIVRECPEFYPAVLDLGIRKLVSGSRGSQEERILKGLQLMLELGEPDHVDEEIDSLIDNLEDIWRFDVAKRCLELLVERHPQKAPFRDYLAHATAQLGDVEAALIQSFRAVAMEPDNPFFLCNLGLFNLMAGNADEARTHLKASLRLAPDNETTQGNLAICEYITAHGGNLFDYQTRPLVEDEIERLADEEDFEKVDRLCDSYDGDRMAAFGQSLVRDDRKRSQCANMISTLTNFFAFVDRVADEVGLVNERLEFVHKHFEAIMHKFIFKFADVDREMIEGIFKSLLEYYGFLESSKLVPTDEFKRFQSTVRKKKKGLLEKMERYNEIRHDPNMKEDEKETIREQLFGGDHAWPHL